MSNISEMKNKILPACLQGNYRDSFGEFSTVACLGLQKATFGPQLNFNLKSQNASLTLILTLTLALNSLYNL